MTKRCCCRSVSPPQKSAMVVSAVRFPPSVGWLNYSIGVSESMGFLAKMQLYG